MRGRWVVWAAIAGALLTVATGCGRAASPTAPADALGEAQPSGHPGVLPRGFVGAFAASRDAVDAAHAVGVVALVPSYADDAETIGRGLEASGAVAIVSAHHVFGGPKAGWAEGWAHTRAWMEPLTRRGLVAAIYVVDEPTHSGVRPDDLAAAVAVVKADGYRTMVAEVVDDAVAHGRTPGVDYFGATCYDWPGFGSWTQERCLTAYRDRPEWDVVIGQAFDLQPRDGSPAAQIARWAEMGRQRAGVLFWVWSWPGQVGIADDPEVAAVVRKAGGR